MTTSKVNFLRTKNTVHINYEGKHTEVTVGDRNYTHICELLGQRRENEVLALLNWTPAVTVEEFIKGSLVLVDGVLKDMEGNTLPTVLAERMQELRNENFPIDTLVKFWDNLKQNPSKNSKEQLYKFLEQNGHPLTEDGCFIAYRGVTADFKDPRTRTFDNSPGSVCRMNREDVDPNPNQTCSRGLHVAAWGYAQGFSAVTVEVKVNPRDVVAVPKDYNGQKMRVCEFTVLRRCENLNNSTVYGTGSSQGSWDGWEEEEEEVVVEQATIDEILNLAGKLRTSYSDRASLASKIEENLDCMDAVNVLASKILEILNENNA